MIKKISIIILMHLVSASLAFASAHFETGSAKPTEALITELMSACSKIDSDSSLIIEGHTDTRGGSEYNLRLSKDRADSVKMFLLEKCDKKPKEIKTIGFGKLYPVSEKHEDNRRVVLHIYGEKIKTIYIAESGTKEENREDTSSKAIAVSVDKPKEETDEDKHYLSLLVTAGSSYRLSTTSNTNSASVSLQRGADAGLQYQYKPKDTRLLLGIGATFFDPMLLLSIGLDMR